MIKVDIKTKSGMSIIIKGNPFEVVGVIKDLEDKEKKKDTRIGFVKKRTSLTNVLNKFIKEGFFNEWKKFRDVSKHLENEGIFLPSSTIHPVLMHMVGKGKLKRKMNPEGVWEYIKVLNR